MVLCLLPGRLLPFTEANVWEEIAKAGIKVIIQPGVGCDLTIEAADKYGLDHDLHWKVRHFRH